MEEIPTSPDQDQTQDELRGTVIGPRVAPPEEKKPAVLRYEPELGPGKPENEPRNPLTEAQIISGKPALNEPLHIEDVMAADIAEEERRRAQGQPKPKRPPLLKPQKPEQPLPPPALEPPYPPRREKLPGLQIIMERRRAEKAKAESVLEAAKTEVGKETVVASGAETEVKKSPTRELNELIAGTLLVPGKEGLSPEQRRNNLKEIIRRACEMLGRKPEDLQPQIEQEELRQWGLSLAAQQVTEDAFKKSQENIFQRAKLPGRINEGILNNQHLSKKQKEQLLNPHPGEAQSILVGGLASSIELGKEDVFFATMMGVDVTKIKRKWLGLSKKIIAGNREFRNIDEFNEEVKRAREDYIRNQGSQEAGQRKEEIIDSAIRNNVLERQARQLVLEVRTNQQAAHEQSRQEADTKAEQDESEAKKRADVKWRLLPRAEKAAGLKEIGDRLERARQIHAEILAGTGEYATEEAKQKGREEISRLSDEVLNLTDAMTGSNMRKEARRKTGYGRRHPERQKDFRKYLTDEVQRIYDERKRALEKPTKRKKAKVEPAVKPDEEPAWLEPGDQPQWTEAQEEELPGEDIDWLGPDDRGRNEEPEDNTPGPIAVEQKPEPAETQETGAQQPPTISQEVRQRMIEKYGLERVLAMEALRSEREAAQKRREEHSERLAVAQKEKVAAVPPPAEPAEPTPPPEEQLSQPPPENTDNAQKIIRKLKRGLGRKRGEKPEVKIGKKLPEVLRARPDYAEKKNPLGRRVKQVMTPVEKAVSEGLGERREKPNHKKSDIPEIKTPEPKPALKRRLERERKQQERKQPPKRKNKRSKNK